MNKKKKKKILQVIKLAQIRCQNLSMSKIHCLKLIGHIFSYQKSGACNKLVAKMGDLFWRVGSWKVIKFIFIAWLQMELFIALQCGWKFFLKKNNQDK